MDELSKAYPRIHLVGIGGAGMEGLARVLVGLGCHVSGSDQMDSGAIDQLLHEGFSVDVGHRERQVKGADLVVFSAAIPADNVEIKAASALGIPVWTRAGMLGYLTRQCPTVAIAGSHGKTTTAAMVAAILRKAGLDPSTLVGGRIDGRVEAGWGTGDYLVLEADEYARTFLDLNPAHCLVTSIDAEHLDCYGDWQGVQAAFAQFLCRLPPGGTRILCGDDEGVCLVRSQLKGIGVTYGLGEYNDYQAVDIEYLGWETRCSVVFRRNELGSLNLPLPGRHNLGNALGAAALSHSLGISWQEIAEGLKTFSSVERRFQLKGEAKGIWVVDDYAHHPAEITAALSAARATGRRVVVAFQPHLYSRTQALMDEFVQALQGADEVVLTAIYAAREAPRPGVDGRALATSLRLAGHQSVRYVEDVSQVPAQLLEDLQQGDLVLFMGAGNIGQMADSLLEGLEPVEPQV